MSVYRKWRLHFGSIATYMQLTEVKFLAADGSDLSTGGIASASSEYSAGYLASYAFDKSNSTDWCSTYGDSACWLAYEHSSPVDVRGVSIRCSTTAYNPASAAGISLQYFDGDWSGRREYALSLVSGGFGSGQTAIMDVRPWSPPSTVLLGLRALGVDKRLPGARLHASIITNNRVMVKTSAEAPESPMPGALVRLHRKTDGRLAWQGLSDAQGYYNARGLEPGVAYVPIAIDPSGTYECVASGPVTAEEPGA